MRYHDSILHFHPAAMPTPSSCTWLPAPWGRARVGPVLHCSTAQSPGGTDSGAVSGAAETRGTSQKLFLSLFQAQAINCPLKFPLWCVCFMPVVIFFFTQRDISNSKTKLAGVMLQGYHSLPAAYGHLRFGNNFDFAPQAAASVYLLLDK